MKNLSERQPHVVVPTQGEVHVLCVTDIRRLASGLPYHGDAAQMIRLLAIAVRDCYDTTINKP
jgi:hypothetical protein